MDCSSSLVTRCVEHARLVLATNLKELNTFLEEIDQKIAEADEPKDVKVEEKPAVEAE